MKNIRIIDEKDRIRSEDHLTRPPRLEGVVKEAMMQPVLKQEKATEPVHTPNKRTLYTEEERKNYQLRSRKH